MLTLLQCLSYILIKYYLWSSEYLSHNHWMPHDIVLMNATWHRLKCSPSSSVSNTSWWNIIFGLQNIWRTIIECHMTYSLSVDCPPVSLLHLDETSVVFRISCRQSLNATWHARRCWPSSSVLLHLEETLSLIFRISVTQSMLLEINSWPPGTCTLKECSVSLNPINAWRS